MVSSSARVTLTSPPPVRSPPGSARCRPRLWRRPSSERLTLRAVHSATTPRPSEREHMEVQQTSRTAPIPPRQPGRCLCDRPNPRCDHPLQSDPQHRPAQRRGDGRHPTVRDGGTRCPRYRCDCKWTRLRNRSHRAWASTSRACLEARDRCKQRNLRRRRGQHIAPTASLRCHRRDRGDIRLAGEMKGCEVSLDEPRAWREQEVRGTRFHRTELEGCTVGVSAGEQPSDGEE